MLSPAPLQRLANISTLHKCVRTGLYAVVKSSKRSKIAPSPSQASLARPLPRGRGDPVERF